MKFFFWRQSELSVKLNRQLERCLRNSKCIDLESLCVVSGEKVNLNGWKVKRHFSVVDGDRATFLWPGMANSGGCTHAESWWQPDGCRQHHRDRRLVPLQTTWCWHPRRWSHCGESVIVTAVYNHFILNAKLCVYAATGCFCSPSIVLMKEIPFLLVSTTCPSASALPFSSKGKTAAYKTAFNI